MFAGSVITRDGAVFFAAGDVGDSEGGATEAVPHGALGPTHDAAVVFGGALHSVDADIGGHGTVLHSGVENVSCNAAHSISASNACVGKVYSSDGAATANCAEEALISIGIIFAAPVETDAADGVSLAVEGALETMVIGANGGVVVLGAGGKIPRSGVGVGDIFTQLETDLVAVVGRIAIQAIHVLGQQVQALGGGDDVGVALRAAARPHLGPVSGVGLVFVGVVSYGDGGARRIAVAARPAIEVVAQARGVVQGDSGRLPGIFRGVVSGNGAAVQVVGDGEGVACIDRGAIALIDALATAAELVACQILDCAADRLNDEGCPRISRDGAGKSEDVGAGATVGGDIRRTAPGGAEGGRTRHGDNLVEGDGNIEGITLGVYAAGNDRVS